MDLRNKRLIDKIASAAITSGMTVLMLGVLIMWVTTEPDTEDDSNTVVIEYDCSEVLADSNGFPDQVITECNRKRGVNKQPTKTTI